MKFVKFEIVGKQPQNVPKLSELLLKAIFHSKNLFLKNVNRYDNHEQRDISKYEEYRYTTVCRLSPLN